MAPPPTPAVPTPKPPELARSTPAPRSPVNGHGVGTPEQTPERQLIVLRQQYRALATELAHTKDELAHLRTELAGTLAGERTARFQAMHDGLTGLARIFHHPQTKYVFCAAKAGTGVNLQFCTDCSVVLGSPVVFRPKHPYPGLGCGLHLCQRASHGAADSIRGSAAVSPHAQRCQHWASSKPDTAEPGACCG